MPNLRFAAPVERRVAVVTGGANGIGRACALRLAEAGRDVVIADLAAEGEAAAQAVRDLGQRGLFRRTDVTDEAAVRALMAEAAASLGRLDILVCCAGVLGREQPFLEQSAAEFERVMRINVFGVYYAHQAALPHMLARGWGRCVTIASAARFGAARLTPYSVSKGAIQSFIASVGSAYARQGVFVNGVEPGRVLTQMVIPRFSAEHLANPNVPVGRYADPEEVAEVVEFLCSERNTYTAGEVWAAHNQAR